MNAKARTRALPRTNATAARKRDGSVSIWVWRWVGVLVALLPSVPAHAQDAERAAMDALNVVLPRAAEERLALSAMPAHLREGAAVYLYGERGFELARSGTNGFSCLVNRDAFFYGARQFKPTCWDAEGATTYLPVMLEVGEMLAAGASAAAIRDAITAGFTAGTFRAPSVGGVAFMLAGDIDVDRTGEIVGRSFPGHYMFYAVGATSQQLGYNREAAQADRTLPSVFAGGAGGAQGLTYIIAVPGESHQH
jgi:hypothetical protein